MGLKIAEALKLSDGDIKRLSKEGFDEVPDKTYALLRCDKASAKMSGNNNLCFDLEHSAIAFPSALADLRLGTPKVWDNGRLLGHPGNCDIVGQSVEYVDKLVKKAAIYHSRLKAYGAADGPLEETELTLAEAQANAPLLIGATVIALLKVFPAGREYTKSDGTTATAKRSKIEIDRVEEATPENLAKRGISKPDVPF